ncbi:MAG: hypothetical protein ACTIA6_13860 [Pseudoclavibacter sp.]
MAEKLRRHPILAVSIASVAFAAVVTAAAVLGVPRGWMALLIFGGLPFILGFAAIVGLRATDSRMAKAGPGVLTALGPGEIRDLPVPAEPMTRLGWKSARAHLPDLLHRRRLVTLGIVVAVGAVIGGFIALTPAEDLVPWHRGVSIALFAVCGAFAAALLPLSIWAAITHRDTPLPRDILRLLQNSTNPVNDQIRINLSRIDEIEQAIEQRRIVYPLLLPIALCATGALLFACAAQLTVTSGQDIPPFAGFAGMTMMLWLPLSTLGRVEQISLALGELRASGEVS